MKTLAELRDVADPAWPRVRSWIDASAHEVTILPPSPARDAALVEAQVSVRSPMGAIVYETGGLLIGGGWVRLLGSGSPRLPRSLPAWNRRCSPSGEGSPPGLFLVADDILGGFYGLNGGAFAAPLGAAVYLAPDTLVWEVVADSYSALLAFLFSDELGAFDEGRRWSSWRDDAAAMSGDEGVLVYPFLWAEGPPIDARARKSVPLLELWRLSLDLQRQLGVAPNALAR